MVHQVLQELSSTTSILLCTAVAVFLITAVSYLRFLIRSPGPWGVPLLGYYPFLKKDIHIKLQKLSEKHGNPYLINIAGQLFVHLSTAKALREVYVTKAEYFPFRSTKYSLVHETVKNGMIFQKGDVWRVQRKFFVQSLREAGLGPNKEELKGPITNAVQDTIEALRHCNGEAVDVNGILMKHCTEAVLRLYLGDISEETARKLNEAYLKLVEPMDGINILLTGNIAKYFIIPWVKGLPNMYEGDSQMKEILHKVISDLQADFDPLQQPRNFIDLYLRERAVRKKKGDPEAKYFSDSALVENLMQGYGDGSVGVQMFIMWFLHKLSHHREAQDAIYEEITEAIGTERLPTWEDRSLFPLTHSAIKELFRTSRLFPIFPSLECVRDTTVLGVHVPKGCVALSNYWAIHHDPNMYKDPYKFDIKRFLPGEAKEEDPVSFSLGKRACAGEGLVMTELFIFLGSLLQNFYFEPVEDVEIKNEKLENYSIYDTTQEKLRVFPRSHQTK